MRRTTIFVLPLVVAALALPAQAAPPLPVPALTRIASKLSGLPVRKKVKVVRVSGAAMDRRTLALLDRDYPRAQQGYDESVYRLLGLLGPTQRLRPILVQSYARGALAVYDPGTRTLFVRKRREVRGAVVRELVQALQDQTFDLRRLSALRPRQRDAALAASAAVEGHAALATQLLGGRAVFSGRLPATHSAPRARAFVDLERRFATTTGLRFAATLRNLGGNSVLLEALRRFPQTTKQIFHIDSYLAREAPAEIALPSSVGSFEQSYADTFGELDVRALLAVNRVPRLDHAADGWMGGRTALYGDRSGARGLVLALRWETERDAAEWGEAAGTFVNEAFDANQPGLPATVSCSAESCWFVAGRAIAFSRSETRTVLAIAPTIAGAEALSAASLDA